MNVSHAWKAPLSWCFALGWMLLALSSNAQTNSFSFSFNDPDRNGREIPVNFHHDLGLEGPSPLVVLAHGFVMTPADYGDLVENLVGEGYVVGVVDTETGFAPSHGDFALDLAFVIRHAAQQVGELSGLLGTASALIGHSMGGGASWLAAADLGDELDALIGLAPAETTPSAQAAGPDIVAPTLLISGSADDVTPPDTQHLPLFNALESVDCRAWVSLVEGGHCGFADAGSLCDFGEILFAGMTRQVQQAHSFSLINSWLDHHVRDAMEGLAPMETYALQASDEVELELSCDWTHVPFLARLSHELPLWPNPATHEVRFDSPLLSSPDVTWRAWSSQGQGLDMAWMGPGMLDVRRWPAGWVLLQGVNDQGEVMHQGRLLVLP